MACPWFAWYPGDYAADTPDLSCEEHGCYRLLLDASWKVGPLPDDLNRLSRLAAGCPPQTVRYVLERYWVRTETGWHNNRLEAERQKAVGYSERQRQAALKRWQPDATAYATALPVDMPLQCPRARTTTTTTTTSTEDPDSVCIEDATDGRQRAVRADPCPYQRIIELWNRTMVPPLRAVEKRTPARDAQLRQRWQNGLGKLDQWVNFFEYIKDSKFLMGRVAPLPGRKPFTADLWWVTKPSHYADIYEGKYHE